MFRYLISVPRSEVTQFLSRPMLLVYARASRNMSVGYICCQSGVKIQKLSAQRENLFRGFCSSGRLATVIHIGRLAGQMPNAQQSVIKPSPFGDRFLTLSYGVTFSLYYDCSLFFSISARRHSHGKLSMSHTFPIESANTRSPPIATLDRRSL
jgi:hypothetical protein